MTLVRKNGSLLNSFPSIFNDFFNRELFDWGESNFSDTGTTIPAVNIRETKDDFEVEMAAPGMKKEDFRIELDGNLLTISSEMKRDSETKESAQYTRREFSYQSFQRSFTLPKEVVDSEKINARYENGVLLLQIPKKEEVKPKPPKMITIA